MEQIKNRTLFTGDNLEVMRTMNSESVDLIYLDPPFNKKFVFPIGKGANAEFGFKDIWGFRSKADENNPYLPDAELNAYNELMWSAEFFDNRPQEIISKKGAKNLVDFLDMMGRIADESAMAYLSFMAIRLLEMKRLLKPAGSVYLHCDQTMGHSIKLLMDIVFGADNFRNEIVWCYKSPSVAKKLFPRKHDHIFYYAKPGGFVFNCDSVRIPYAPNTVARRKYKSGGVGGGVMPPEQVRQGMLVPDWWSDIPSGGQIPKAERKGYPTQKPVALLKRIILASSNEGDFVLDPFCGCATTCIAAEQLGLQWTGIDVAAKSADLVYERLLEETEQGRLGDRVPEVHRRDFGDESQRPMRTDIAGTRSKNIKSLLYGQQNGNCALCGTHFEIQHFHVDHIVAKAKGGLDIDSNLQLLCGHCNSVKSDGTMRRAKERLRELGYAA